MNTNTVTLSVELTNRILAYLSRQPYAEVAVMIADIQRAATPASAIQVPEKPARNNGPKRAEAPASFE